MMYPDWLIQDIRIISQIPYISNVTHSHMDGYADICFDLTYGDYAQASEERLSNPEPIKLRYNLSKLPSKPAFLSNRDTFPKNLPHLNPVSEDHPTSICLWRKGGNSSLYEQKGIASCLEVLKDWLEDASLEKLQHDGWEPTPRGGVISFNINLGEWQEIAINPKNCGKILSIPSGMLISNKSGMPQIGWVIPQYDIKIQKNNNHFFRSFKYNEVSKIRTYFLVPDEDFIESDHSSLKLDSFNNLLAYSKNKQLSQAIQFAQSCKKPKGCSAVVLAIAHRRPLPLIKEIPSISTIENASKVEITTILIVHDNKDFSFHELETKSPATPEMLAKISGIDKFDKDISVLGCGSVGSAISDFLMRAGHKHFSLWDDDVFEAHNNARHVLHQTRSERAITALEFKSYKLRARIEEINHEATVRHFIRRFNSDEVSKLRKNTHVIDATGEAIEPSWLHDLTVPYSRVFITDTGNLAFQLTQVPDNIADMLDIEAVLFSMASNNNRIKEWLQRESHLSNTMLGLSCSSTTMEMPWFKISNHVSSLMPSLLQQIKSPSISVVMNDLDPDGSPKGLTTFNVDDPKFKFQKAEVKDSQEIIWTITFNQAVLDKIHEVRENLLPREAAGYLLGLYNVNTKRISIVIATQGQFNSSSSSATLASIENDSEAQKTLTDSNNMLKPLGTWHSHPGSSAQPSPTDERTFDELLSIKERTLPTVMLICANSDTHFLVGINRDI
ncbi:Mov34/MPN/PAD-1 family protein [Vibrio tritonius]|uniref:Mov34/MPN/PAD-1 family protein n=1 Tax=Vibrio tritonius TaxID=1435069 RepID=UPI00315DA58C